MPWLARAGRQNCTVQYSNLGATLLGWALASAAEQPDWQTYVTTRLLTPLAMTLVQDGLLDLPTLLARLTAGPAKALRLPVGRLAVGAPADLVLFDPQGSTLAGETWFSKGQNCPFIGHCLPAAVRYTLVDGRISYQN